MTKKHIQASGEKEGQLVDCPAVHQCTLKGPDGERQQHFDIKRPLEDVENDIQGTNQELVSVNKLPDGSQSYSDTHNETIERKRRLLEEKEEHLAAQKAQQAYSAHMATKYSAGSSVGAGKEKTYGDTQFTKKELNTVVDDALPSVKRVYESFDLGGSAKDMAEDRIFTDAFYHHTGKGKLTADDLNTASKLARQKLGF